jgi:hypothetical protein
MVFQCDPYESIRDSRRQPLFTYYLLGHNGVPRFFSKFSPVGRSMAEFIMHQNDVQQLSSFIHDCFLTRALGVDPLYIEVDSDVATKSGCYRI